MKAKRVAIIPKPTRILEEDGQFMLDSESVIWAPSAPEIGTLLSRWIDEELGLQLAVETCGDKSIGSENAIELSLSEGGSAEGYHLAVKGKGVKIRAGTKAGLFYGCQTLRQLLTIHGSRKLIPRVAIDDRPRFSWRGLHLDVARHMFPVSFIKRFLDLMAMHKLNVFHWHLTDDQGWRIEIKRYPQLTEVGAWRNSTPLPSARTKRDGLPYGGFYTQEEIKEVVDYAHMRHITVVPEIEMPGHAVAALASFPKLSCRGGEHGVRTTWGIAEDVFCAGNEDCYAFLRAVLSEVLELFPSEFIHIGGDECPKTRWKECPKCQAKIKEQNLQNEDELQSYFIRRMEAFLLENGRRLIGWDEILEGGLAPNAVVMSWRGTQGGIEAASQGHDVVMTPTEHCYFDYYQSEETAAEPPAIGGLITLEKVLAFNPSDGVPGDKIHHVLGGQANVWTEYIRTPAQLEYMTYPRAIALAEVVWTGDDNPDFSEFLGRLRTHLLRLENKAVHYRPLDD